MPSSLDVHIRHVCVRCLLDNCMLLVVPPPIIVALPFLLCPHPSHFTTTPSPNSCECVVEKCDNMRQNSGMWCVQGINVVVPNKKEKNKFWVCVRRVCVRRLSDDQPFLVVSPLTVSRLPFFAPFFLYNPSTPLPPGPPLTRVRASHQIS
jgi:hypothetical protein